MFLYGTIVTHVLQPEWTHSSFGGVVAKVIGITSSDYETLVQFSIRTEDIMFSVSLLIQFVMSLAIIICYVAMLFELRSTMRKISVRFVQSWHSTIVHSSFLHTKFSNEMIPDSTQ